MAFAQHHGCGDFFTQLGVRHGKRHDLHHGGVVHQYFVNFAGRYFFTATVDDFFQASGERQVTVGRQRALVARTEPAMGKTFGVGLRIVFITQRDVLTTNHNLTDLAGGHQAAVQVHDADFRACRQAD